MRHSLALWTLLLLHSPASLLARGDGTFEGPLAFALPGPIAIGDFNRDGLPDLGGAGAVLIQDRAGTNGWTRRPYTPGATLIFIRAADFDGDGDDDLVGSDRWVSSFFIRSNGDGTFLPAVPIAGTAFSRWLAVGDWDGDGKLDLASVISDPQTVSIHRGGGDGTFTLVENQKVPGRPYTVEALDYDGDATLDLIVSLNVPALMPLKGKGDGTFVLQPAISGRSVECYRYLATEDLNRDGRRDLITHCGVKINLGDGTFKDTAHFSGSFPGDTIAAGDLNGDGAVDLLLPGQFHAGRGDGEFLPSIAVHASGEFIRDLDGDGQVEIVSPGAAIFRTRKRPRLIETSYPLERFRGGESMAVADFDRNGAPDLFFSGLEGTQVYLNPGSTLPILPALFIRHRRYTSMAAADLDGDGVVDLAGASYSAAAAVVTFLDPAGNVRGETGMRAGYYPVGIRVGRIDDGPTPDLAVPSSGSNHVAVFLNQGGGVFAEAPAVRTRGSPADVTVGDLDLDGRGDLVAVADGAISIHFAEAGGRFSEPIHLSEGFDFRYRATALGDLDGDGRPDLLAGETSEGSLHLFRGTGSRTLQSPIIVAERVSTVHLELADLDGNGLLDINAGGWVVLLNRGSQGFSALMASQGGAVRGEVQRLADFDQDGALDLAYSSPLGASIIFGRPAPASSVLFRRGDADGNGKIQVTDPIRILGRLFLGGEALGCEDAADADDDGALNMTDAILLLGRLFLGGAALPPPGPEGCGEDPTPDQLPPCQPGC